jgi:hypothetical protein
MNMIQYIRSIHIDLNQADERLCLAGIGVNVQLTMF